MKTIEEMDEKVMRRALVHKASLWLESYMESLGYIDEWCRLGANEFEQAMMEVEL